MGKRVDFSTFCICLGVVWIFAFYKEPLKNRAPFFVPPGLVFEPTAPRIVPWESIYEPTALRFVPWESIYEPTAL